MLLDRASLLWICYFFISGILTYYFFELNILRIILAVIAFETFYFLWRRKYYNLTKRYFFNIFYLLGFTVMMTLDEFDVY